MHIGGKNNRPKQKDQSDESNCSHKIKRGLGHPPELPGRGCIFFLCFFLGLLFLDYRRWTYRSGLEHLSQFGFQFVYFNDDRVGGIRTIVSLVFP